MSLKSFLANLTGKAGSVAVEGQGITTANSGFQIVTGQNCVTDLSPANLIKFNTGWAFNYIFKFNNCFC